MLHDLSQQALQALGHAGQLANSGRASKILAEHIAAGALSDDTYDACRVLSTFNLDLSALRSTLDAHLPYPPISGGRPFSREATLALEEAERMTVAATAQAISTAHLLAGVITVVPDCRAAAELRSHGISSSSITESPATLHDPEPPFEPKSKGSARRLRKARKTRKGS